jgi:hypothetical protein
LQERDKRGKVSLCIKVAKGESAGRVHGWQISSISIWG